MPGKPELAEQCPECKEALDWVNFYDDKTPVAVSFIKPLRFKHMPGPGGRTVFTTVQRFGDKQRWPHMRYGSEMEAVLHAMVCGRVRRGELLPKLLKPIV